VSKQQPPGEKEGGREGGKEGLPCNTHSMSKRCKMGSVSSTFSANVREESYLPPIGLAAATTEHLACKLVTIPAFDTEILCCSSAS